MTLAVVLGIDTFQAGEQREYDETIRWRNVCGLENSPRFARRRRSIIDSVRYSLSLDVYVSGADICTVLHSSTCRLLPKPTPKSIALDFSHRSCPCTTTLCMISYDNRARPLLLLLPSTSIMMHVLLIRLPRRTSESLTLAICICICIALLAPRRRESRRYPGRRGHEYVRIYTSM